ncbi:TrmH family RNA methyltransferase [Aureimonas pseudogalii]|uniref:TrmH family RNA methyltransferase n=1 Tax=Aureimonas pseudogalii TaxID=1744844 RepID=A0A7W6EAJ3_9HYPH|nr:RNA methyltransferase [Aureimonas pseudogalii]MBB3997780.1 TrmH family RNA methyltransferase [Aureimonas pseudogalii]
MTRDRDDAAPPSRRPEQKPATVAPGRVKEVTSVSNPIVKDIRNLALKKHREETGLFLAEGLKLAIDALDAGWQLETLIVARSQLHNELLSKTAARAVSVGADLLEASDKVLAAIARRDNPQSAIGVFRQKAVRAERIDLGRDGLLVVLDRVRDPGNLGTILRTADAAGARGVVLVGECVDPFSLEAVRATMGSIFSVPVARMDEPAFLAMRKGFGGLVVGTHMRGETDYRTPAYGKGATMLVMGNEQSGLSEPLAGACDTLVRIPQVGRADSLNLAVATGLMIFEARRGSLKL